jgi:hypothetical protein
VRGAGACAEIHEGIADLDDSITENALEEFVGKACAVFGVVVCR